MGMPYDNTNNNSNEKLTRKHERIQNPDVQSFLYQVFIIFQNVMWKNVNVKQLLMPDRLINQFKYVICLYESACYLCYVQDSLPKIRRNAAISSSLLPHTIHAKNNSFRLLSKNLSQSPLFYPFSPHKRLYLFVVYLYPSSPHILYKISDSA